MQQELLTVKQAAPIIGKSEAATYMLVLRGRIPSQKLGRSVVIPRRALMTWLDQMNQGALDEVKPGGTR